MRHPDEDIKIYTADQSRSPAGGSGEDSAAEYVMHRENGNLEKTHQLGELLAQTLVGDSKRLEEEDCTRHKLVLLSYLAIDELEQKLGNLILQKSAVAAMNLFLEKTSPDILEIVTDTAAFTLYIHNDRRMGSKTTGQVLCQLCGRDDDKALAARGDELAEEYRRLFGGIIDSYNFK